MRQRLGINRIGFRAFEQGFGEMMGLSRVHHTHRKPFVDETRSQTHPIRSGCFHDHEDLAWYNAGRLELVQKTGIAFGRLLDRKRPTGFRPGSLGSNHGGLCGDIDPNEKRIRRYCLVCRHSNLPLLQVCPGFSLGCLTPTGCQSSSARDAWSTPQDTVQSSDNLESWGTLFAPRSRPPLSYGPHHDPGVQLSIQAILMRIIRAVIRCHLTHAHLLAPSLASRRPLQLYNACPLCTSPYHPPLEGVTKQRHWKRHVV